jgi:hypothetical protein
VSLTYVLDVGSVVFIRSSVYAVDAVVPRVWLVGWLAGWLAGWADGWRGGYAVLRRLVCWFVRLNWLVGLV